MKHFNYLLCAVMALAIASTQPASAGCKQKKQSIVILYENDVHCAVGGYQYLAGLRDAVSDTAYVAVVSSGDFVQGGTAGAISRGQYVADIMRTVNYDAITLGNHEFDFPVAHTDSLLKYIGAPVVSANLYRHDNNKAVYNPFIIKKFGKTIEGFANNLIPKSNPTAVDIEPRRYKVSWKRDEWKPYPLYVFGPCINGVVETMLPGLYAHKQIRSTDAKSKKAKR